MTKYATISVDTDVRDRLLNIKGKYESWNAFLERMSFAAEHMDDVNTVRLEGAIEKQETKDRILLYEKTLETLQKKNNGLESENRRLFGEADRLRSKFAKVRVDTNTKKLDPFAKGWTNYRINDIDGVAKTRFIVPNDTTILVNDMMYGACPICTLDLDRAMKFRFEAGETLSEVSEGMKIPREIVALHRDTCNL